ncbi:MAG: DMT family transporter [Planctomycetota bacterium]|nr:MAG: DMT family transporter [Planctomycetota bacterium]
MLDSASAPSGRKRLDDRHSMTATENWLTADETPLWLFAVAVAVPYVIVLATVRLVIVRIPADYFAKKTRGHARFEHLVPPLRWLVLVAKNALGLLFLVAGAIMFVVPGPGALSMLLGVLLLDFPGKYELERWCISRNSVRRGVDYLRRRAGSEPLIIEDVVEGPTARVIRGRLLIVLAAVLWSTSGVFAKSEVFHSWPLDEGGWPVRGTLLAFWRAVFAGAVILPFVRHLPFRWSLVTMSLAFLLMNMTYLPALTLTTAANAIWLQNTAPIWVYLFGALVLRERILRRDWLLLLFGMLGVALILSCEFHAGAETGRTSLKGALLGTLSGVFYAGIVISLRGLRQLNSAWLMLCCHFVTAAALLPVVIAWGIWPEGHQWLYLAAFGALQLGIPYLLFARGVRDVAGHEASGLVLLEPVLVPLWVWVAYRGTASYDPPAWWTIAGAALILSGLLIRYFGAARRQLASLRRFRDVTEP